MDWKYLFTSLEGRIGRRQFRLGGGDRGAGFGRQPVLLRHRGLGVRRPVVVRP